jgi:hypothetical protein
MEAPIPPPPPARLVLRFLPPFLTHSTAEVVGHLLLEFNIPRMGLRADAVLVPTRWAEPQP